MDVSELIVVMSAWVFPGALASRGDFDTEPAMEASINLATVLCAKVLPTDIASAPVDVQELVAVLASILFPSIVAWQQGARASIDPVPKAIEIARKLWDMAHPPTEE